MSADDRRLAAVITRIDEANSSDPTLIEYQGRELRKEPLHAELMTSWMLRLDPDAGPLSMIAARGHHIRRWTRPRSDHPDGRSGYLRWRSAAQRFHAEEVAEIMRSEGYDDESIDRVGRLIRKQGLGVDPAVQVHEDARCLVFLDTQLDQTADRVGDAEMVAILIKTLPKMSPRGIEAAMTLELGTRAASLVQQAVDVVAEDSST